MNENQNQNQNEMKWKEMYWMDEWMVQMGTKSGKQANKLANRQAGSSFLLDKNADINCWMFIGRRHSVNDFEMVMPMMRVNRLSTEHKVDLRNKTAFKQFEFRKNFTPNTILRTKCS